MGCFAGPEIPSDGLVLALDGANFKSFKGEATTNLIPSPTLNAYPTTGNGWYTYNTNQYGSGAYFSIGSVASVSSNIVTMTSAHSLRTYDVMRPQTTGGGVTADTDYFIKKVSDTSFTLHAYNGSQDGSQGYISSSTGTHKVYDSIATDTRISVNSTSFPTMWWGAPHLPNSGLVKELRYGEFNAIPNLPANDCIRLHYIRTDGVMDGMSYGVDCAVTPSSPVTVSFYTRAATASAVGKQIQYQIYNYSGGSPTGYSFNFTLGAVGVWERQTLTFTPANSVIISYWFAASSGVYSWDWSCMQVEQKSYVTSFVAGTRGTTVATGGGWADLSANGNNGELLNGVRENSNNLGSLVFDGVDDHVIVGSLGSQFTNFTVEIWFKSDSVTNYRNPIDCNWLVENGSYSNLGPRLEQNSAGNLNWIVGSGSDVYSFVTLVPSGLSSIPYHHAVITKTSSTNFNGYYNGNYTSSLSFSGWAGSMLNVNIGRGFSPSGERWFIGKIPSVKIYNRALSAAEIQQNFNATKSRYGL